MFALKAGLGFSAGASRRGSEPFVGVALQCIEATRMCQKASLRCSRGLRLRALLWKDMLDWDTERGDKHVCLLGMWLEQIVDMLYVCVCVYSYMRETLTKIVYSQLHTEGFANQKNRTVFPSFPAWGLKFRLIFASGYRLLWKQNSLSRLTVSRLALLQIFVVAWTFCRCYQEVIRVLNKDRKQGVKRLYAMRRSVMTQLLKMEVGGVYMALLIEQMLPDLVWCKVCVEKTKENYTGFLQIFYLPLRDRKNWQK